MDLRVYGAGFVAEIQTFLIAWSSCAVLSCGESKEILKW